jgi:hypothetical protein
MKVGNHVLEGGGFEERLPRHAAPLRRHAFPRCPFLCVITSHGAEMCAPSLTNCGDLLRLWRHWCLHLLRECFDMLQVTLYIRPVVRLMRYACLS